MKRVMAILTVAMLLVVLLTACGGEMDDSVDIVGAWNTTKGGQVGDFVFNVGGGGKVTVGEEFAEITWSTKDDMLTVYVEDSPLLVDAPYTIKEDQLIITYNGITQVFTKK